jgi:transcription initiation factor TFIIF subunit alpha
MDDDEEGGKDLDFDLDDEIEKGPLLSFPWEHYIFKFKVKTMVF